MKTMRLESLDYEEIKEFLVRVYVDRVDYWASDPSFYRSLRDKFQSFAKSLENFAKRRIHFAPPINDLNLYHISVSLNPRVTANRYERKYLRIKNGEHAIFLEAFGSGLAPILEISWHDYYREGGSWAHHVYDLKDPTWFENHPESNQIVECLEQAAKDSELLIASREITTRRADERMPEAILWHENLSQIRDYLFLGWSD